ncbi:MAG: endonuclease/exonuclease/phosphatase family protein [Akkermansiaceae bacterium]
MRLFLLLALTSFAQAELTLATFNIRYAGGDRGKNSWENRRALVSETITKIDPDILGLQEALHRQIAFLEKKLPAYAWVGVGRDDGKKAGEFSPLFYREEKFKLLDQGTFWLSKTPQVPGSKSWDTVCTRVCTWARLKQKSDGKIVTAFNTHWDHRGQKAREESAKLILPYLEKPDLGQIVVMGDFNATETNPALKTLTGAGLTNSFLSLHAAHKNRNTFHPWNGKTAGTGTIDHILLGGTPVIKKSWIDHHSRKGQWPSDHYPVVTVME